MATNHSICTQYIILGNFFGYTSRHHDITAAKNKDFVSIKDSILILIKDNKFVAILFFDFFSELF